MDNKFIEWNNIFAKGFIVTAIIMFSSVFVFSSINGLTTNNYTHTISTNTFGEHWYEAGLFFMGIISTLIMVKNNNEI